MSNAMRLKAEIRKIAQENRVTAQAVLQNFMLERLLERISISKHKDRFVLKGGMLIASIVGLGSRTTMDMDTTLRDYPLSENSIRAMLTEICALHLNDDVTLSVERIESIREDDAYGGFRVAITAIYESIRTPIKMDVTAGDVITPGAVRYLYVSNFEDKSIEIWGYNLETILAEKVETILRRGVLNTRPRDYYDVYVRMKTHRQDVDKKLFIEALRATSENRGSLPVLSDREKILAGIRGNSTMKQRWDRYRHEYYYAKEIEFEDLIQTISTLFKRSIPAEG